MKTLFEYLISIIFAVVLIVIVYTLFGRALLNSMNKTFEPLHAVQSLRPTKGEK